MNDSLEMYLASFCTGATVTALAYGCGDYFGWGFAAIEKDLAEKFRRLRVSTRNLRRYVIAWLIVLWGVFLGVGLGLNSVAIALVVCVFLAAVPWYVVRRMAERRQQKIEEQLADAMVSLSSAVKAGLALPQALEMLAAQCPKPINTEFHQIVAEYHMGKPLERTMLEAKDRLRSENFALLTAALLASHESGGKLNETVERIAQSVLELQRLERKVHSETAQARKSAIYMALAPLFILVAYYFIDPVNTRRLWTTTVGQILLAAAIVLDVIAYLWARVILNPDI